jgi:hypothetical protein
VLLQRPCQLVVTPLPSSPRFVCHTHTHTHTRILAISLSLSLSLSLTHTDRQTDRQTHTNTHVQIYTCARAYIKIHTHMPLLCSNVDTKETSCTRKRDLLYTQVHRPWIWRKTRHTKLNPNPQTGPGHGAKRGIPSRAAQGCTSGMHGLGFSV